MINNKTFLAIIPARGGSKRLPRKNLLNLYGKPLIAWTIDAALNSKYLDQIVVTSDDDEILSVAKQEKVQLIKRPSDLATDTATTIDTLIHSIESQSEQYDYCILLQPTSPLRSNKHIDEAIELLIEKNADAVISVCQCEHSPLWASTLPPDGSMDNFISDEIKNIRGQDLPVHYRLNGAIYIANVEELLKQKTFMLRNKSFAYRMDPATSVDIDSKIDYILAAFLKQESDDKN
jgi:CMP-N,N'-diacetyllegionaminic acid synthase